jgi:hypothetical protein
MKVNGKDYPIYYGKIKNVPNHQPVVVVDWNRCSVGHNSRHLERLWTRYHRLSKCIFSDSCNWHGRWWTVILVSTNIGLVGGMVTYPSEKCWNSSVGMMTFPTEWKVIKFHGSKAPTRISFHLKESNLRNII